MSAQPFTSITRSPRRTGKKERERERNRGKEWSFHSFITELTSSKRKRGCIVALERKSRYRNLVFVESFKPASFVFQLEAKLCLLRPQNYAPFYFGKKFSPPCLYKQILSSAGKWYPGQPPSRSNRLHTLLNGTIYIERVMYTHHLDSFLVPLLAKIALYIFFLSFFFFPTLADEGSTTVFSQ